MAQDKKEKKTINAANSCGREKEIDLADRGGDSSQGWVCGLYCASEEDRLIPSLPALNMATEYFKGISKIPFEGTLITSAHLWTYKHPHDENTLLFFFNRDDSLCAKSDSLAAGQPMLFIIHENRVDFSSGSMLLQDPSH
jgi:hypothetical protein